MGVGDFPQSDSAVDPRVGHLRTWSADREVALIVERGVRLLAVEVKLSQVVNDRDVRQLRWLRDALGDDLTDAMIITAGPAAYRPPDGIAVVPAALLGP